MSAALVVGAAAAMVSLLRLWLGNHSALTEVIWAEDGVFPLCVDKSDFWTCLADPFAGYLLFLPRLVAGFVAWLPVEGWALATNLIAAALAGLTAAFALVISRRFGLGWVSGVVIALLPVIAPVVGFEAINAIGSSYMLLLYLSALVLVLWRRTASVGWTTTTAVAALLLLTALTIPTTAVLLAVIAVNALRRVLPVRQAVIWSAVVLVGLAAQWHAASSAVKPREIVIGTQTFDAWVGAIPDTVLTYWPGLRLSEYTLFDVFPVTPLAVTGLLVVLAFVAGGLALVLRGGDKEVSIGLFLLVGIALGAIPSIIGWVNNRYFVVPLLLWGAAAMVALDAPIRRSRPWVVGVVAAGVLVVWWPAIPASAYRTTPAPPWSAEVARVEARCKADPGFTERIIFSPYWPENWGDALSEPTHPDLPCLVAWRWMGPNG